MTEAVLSPVTTVAEKRADSKSRGFWTLAWQRFRDDRVGVVSLVIVAAFLIVVLLSATGLVAGNWNREVAIHDAPPDLWGLLKPAAPTVIENATHKEPFTITAESAEEWKHIEAQLSATVVDPLAETLQALGAGNETVAVVKEKRASLPLGGDRWGRDVLSKTIKGSQTSIIVGLSAALLATLLGTVLGALAGYYGGRIDDALNWFYNVFSAIPYLLLILAVAAVLQQRGVMTVILILGLTGWSGVFRLIRAEYIKHRGREYVQAAHAFGVPNRRILFFHILPNVFHVVLVNISILAVGFIKAEVILSYLGFGVKVDEVSWGSMLNDAQGELILGRWWELVAAGGAMALLVTAFSLLTDAMRDAMDPKIQKAS